MSTYLQFFTDDSYSVGDDVPKLDAGCCGNFYCLGERTYIKNHRVADLPLFQLSL